MPTCHHGPRCGTAPAAPRPRIQHPCVIRMARTQPKHLVQAALQAITCMKGRRSRGLPPRLPPVPGSKHRRSQVPGAGGDHETVGIPGVGDGVLDDVAKEMGLRHRPVGSPIAPPGIAFDDKEALAGAYQDRDCVGHGITPCSPARRSRLRPAGSPSSSRQRCRAIPRATGVVATSHARRGQGPKPSISLQ